MLHLPSHFMLRFAQLILFCFVYVITPAQAATPMLGVDNIKVCMNFGCKSEQVVSLSRDEWDGISNWLKPHAVDAQTERDNLKQAIGWMEHIIGKHTPTYRDLGGSLSSEAKFPGQLDCIDESLNTTTYLKLFEQNGLLKHHKVIERAYRRTIFDQHWAGQIQTLVGNDRWVIDSWFQHNGYLPYVQRSIKWEDIPLFTSYLDSSQQQQDKKQSFFRRLFN